jgi:hypothetical protein
MVAPMLAAEVQSKTIDGVTYHVLPLAGMPSLMVAGKLMKMAAPAFADVPSLLAAARHLNSVLEALASGVVADLDVDVIAYAAREFGRVTQYEVGPIKKPLIADASSDFDEHFRGRFMTMLRWLAFAASVTFPFPKATESATAAPAAAPEAG